MTVISTKVLDLRKKKSQNIRLVCSWTKSLEALTNCDFKPNQFKRNERKHRYVSFKTKLKSTNTIVTRELVYIDLRLDPTYLT